MGLKELIEKLIKVSDGDDDEASCHDDDFLDASMASSAGFKNNAADLCSRISNELESHLNSLDRSGIQSGENEDEHSDEENNQFSYTSKRNKSKKGRASLSSVATVEGTTLRSILGNIASNQMSQLANILTDLMSRRVDAEDLMPQTMNTQINEAVMTDQAPAITLTRTSLAAAMVYCQMVALPGAISLVQMQAVSALLALLKRWKTEVTTTSRAREAQSSNKQKTNNKNKKKTKKRLQQERLRKSKKRFRTEDGDDDVESFNYEECSENDEEEQASNNAHSVEGDKNESEILTSDQLVMKGLELAQKVAVMPLQREFMSWSDVAREALMEATTLTLVTASALQASSKRKNRQDIADLAHAVEQSAAEACKQCILMEGNNKNIVSPSNNNDIKEFSPASLGDNNVLNQRHEITVHLLRGLYSTIAMKEELPNGEEGRQLAASLASRVLCSFVQELVSDISQNPHRWPAFMQDNRSNKKHLDKACDMKSTVKGPAKENDEHGAVTPTSSRNTARKSIGAESTSCRRNTFGAPSSVRNRVTELVVTPARIKGASKSPLTAPRTVAFKPSAAKQPLSGWRTSSDEAKSNGHNLQHPRLVLSAVVGILEKLAAEKGLERAAVRNSVIPSLHRCVTHLPARERNFYLHFLIKLSNSKVPVHRLVAAEIVGLVLAEPWVWESNGTVPPSDPDVCSTPHLGQKSCPRQRKPLSHALRTSGNGTAAALFGILQERFCDKAPTVRTAAIAALTKILREVGRLGDTENQGLMEAISDIAASLARDLRVRASMDEKSFTKKAAIEALVEVLVMAESAGSNPVTQSLMTEDDINILVDRCKDTSVVTRKAAAEGLTYLLEKCIASHEDESSLDGVKSLLSAWTASVLPMTLDAELGVAVKAVELVNRAVVQPLLGGSYGATRVSWRILATLGGGPDRTRVSRAEPEAMGKAMSYITEKETTLLKNLLELICSIGNDKSNADDLVTAGAWSLCYALVNAPNVLKNIPSTVRRHKIDLSFLGSAWEEFLQASSVPDPNGNCLAFIRTSVHHSMNVISKLAPCVDSELAERTKNRILEMLSSFAIPAEVVGSAISAITSLTVASHPDKTSQEHKAACSVWIKALYQACHEEVSLGFDNLSIGMQEASTVRALCTLGEAAMVGFSPTEEDEVLVKDDVTGSKKGPLGVEAIIGLRVQPAAKLVQLVQMCMAKVMPGQDERPTSRVVRAHAFLTFGRLCLRDVELAKSALDILARELHQNMSFGCPNIQSNALLILGDLCVRYTNLVDRYLPVMAACLQSGITDMSSNNILTRRTSTGFAPVRKSAVILLSSLIMQDYIKWRGLLFHRFLVATTDEDDEVADIAEVILSGPLAIKQPKLFFSHFVEAFFVLNCCAAHPIYVAAASAGDGGSGIAVGFDGINLKGEVGKARRHRMYELMLSKMSDEEKLEATGRIAKEILGGALIKGSDLYQACAQNGNAATRTATSESAFEVLGDALRVLQSRSIRVGRAGKSNGNSSEQGVEVEIDDPTTVPNLGKHKKTAMDKLLSNISRKHMIEAVLPIVCQLKELLQKHCSPLLKDLMGFFVEIFRLYKTEVHENLANDPQLLQEIEYDARQFQKERHHTRSSVAASSLAPLVVSVPTEKAVAVQEGN